MSVEYCHFEHGMDIDKYSRTEWWDEIFFVLSYFFSMIFLINFLSSWIYLSNWTLTWRQQGHKTVAQPNAKRAFLGQICTDQGLKPDHKKILAMKKYPRPHDKDAIRRFVAFANYYRRFVDNSAKLTKPLSNLTKNTWNTFQMLKSKWLGPKISGTHARI